MTVDGWRSGVVLAAVDTIGAMVGMIDSVNGPACRATVTGGSSPVSAVILPRMRNDLWRVDVGEDNARWLTTECRTARLASEYRPMLVDARVVEFNALALGAIRELGEEEDGYITEDGEGLRIWIGDDAFELELHEPHRS